MAVLGILLPACQTCLSEGRGLPVSNLKLPSFYLPPCWFYRTVQLGLGLGHGQTWHACHHAFPTTPTHTMPWTIVGTVLVYHASVPTCHPRPPPPSQTCLPSLAFFPPGTLPTQTGPGQQLPPQPADSVTPPSCLAGQAASQSSEASLTYPNPTAYHLQDQTNLCSATLLCCTSPGGRTDGTHLPLPHPYPRTAWPGSAFSETVVLVFRADHHPGQFP